MRKLICLILTAALCAALFTGCGSSRIEPVSIIITRDGEETALIEVLNGADPVELRAEVSPEGCEGEIVWSSEDSGIVKPESGADGSCRLIFKKTGSAKITVTCGSVSASLRVHVLKNQDKLTSLETALSINGRAYSAEMCSIYLADMYYSFLDEFGEYAVYYGLDPYQGIGSLSDQSCDYSSDGTWYGYFMDSLPSQILQVQALCEYGAAQGITLSGEELTELDVQLAQIAADAAEYGFGSTDDYLAARCGRGVTEKLYRSYMEETALADKVYSTCVSGFDFTEEELKAQFDAMGYGEGDYGYRLVSMRHILILAEMDEYGEYTEEALEEARRQAEDIYDLWISGERTEESFAALAEQYSQDGGSNTAGGLYEDIYKGEMVDGINSWLFDEARSPGDTAVIDNDGSYVGTHVVYFSGFGEVYSDYLARSELTDAAVTEWFTGVTGGYTAEQGLAWSDIGRL